MSTEREATPPARIWLSPSAFLYTTTPSPTFLYGVKEREPQDIEYIRADSFDTMRDALRDIEQAVKLKPYIDSFDAHVLQLASSALAAIDGKDGGGDGCD